MPKRGIYCVAGPHGVPERKTPGAAGFDICASGESCVVPAYTPEKGTGTKIIDTSLVTAIPPGYYGQIQSRSGLAFKENVTAFPGVVDSDYRGEIKVLMFNNGPEPFHVKDGDRIAQLLVLPCEEDICFVATDAENLSKTERGEGGFGSTGGAGTKYSDFVLPEDGKSDQESHV